MINHISIKDFAIIENTNVDFQEGLNIITGETGAGKSIVIEGISLALGARADSSYIRNGCDKAIIQLAGELNSEEIVITRELSSTGKNLCKLNGDIITLTQLKDVCTRLADIHGQYDNQSLLNPDSHIDFLDAYKKDLIQPLKLEVSQNYSDYSKVKGKLDELIKNEKENLQKKDFYQFQLNEIDKLDLRVGEDTDLDEKISLLENSEKIFYSIENVYSKVYGEGSSVMDTLFSSLKDLEEISSFSQSIGDIKDVFSDAYYNIEDLNSTLRDLKESITYSPEELDRAIARSEQINEAKNKYGNSIEDILEYRERINSFLGNIIDFDHSKSQLSAQVDEKYKDLLESCKHLTDARKNNAEILCQRISNELSQLNFKNSEIKIVFNTFEHPTSNGMESIEMLISTNKGEPLKPLARIASGGEMSRIMLALKNIISTYDDIPTLIFDEIDNGISGVTASIVGQKLKEISKEHQIICITHLPQIAACGNSNYLIVKEENSNSTVTNIQKLTQQQKVEEIARLIGGTTITSNTLTSAKELISNS